MYGYVGNNWENDKDVFQNSLKVHSKKKELPRTYLVYRGACEKESAMGETKTIIAPILVHTNDMGREYDSIGNEPTILRTEDVFNEFKVFFENKLEEIIMSYR